MNRAVAYGFFKINPLGTSKSMAWIVEGRETQQLATSTADGIGVLISEARRITPPDGWPGGR